MKRFLCFLLLTVFCVSSVCGFAEETEDDSSIYMHGYRSPYGNYIIGVPVEWAFVGKGSTSDDLLQARSMVSESVINTILNSCNEQNDILLAVSPERGQLILTYGSAVGVDNESLLSQEEALKARLSQTYTGLAFTDECGSYEYKSLVNLLLLAANYNGYSIYQYFLCYGSNLYVFTFTNIEKSMTEIVLDNFRVE